MTVDEIFARLESLGDDARRTDAPVWVVAMIKRRGRSV